MTRRRMVLASLLAAALPLRAQTRRMRIFVLLAGPENDMDRAFRAALERERLDAEFVVREPGLDQVRVATAVREARARGADLVYASGHALARAIVGAREPADPAHQLTDIPVVYTTASDPVLTARNLCGASGAAPLERQLDLMQAYRPFERVAILCNPADPLAQARLDTLEAAARARRVALIPRYVPLNAHGEPIAAAVPDLAAAVARQGAQLLYAGSDPWLAANRRALSDAALALHLPLFSTVEETVRAGYALYGAAALPGTVGGLAAVQALAILRGGAQPATLGIARPQRWRSMINMGVADKLGLYPPVALLSRAEVVR
ncbi:MAG: ABC transporter substrate binding protein [Telluria sp.]